MHQPQLRQLKVPDTKINSDHIHLWQVNLDQKEGHWENLLGILSTDEQERASRFHFEKERNRFIIARGMLRQILGQYLNEKAHKLQFEYDVLLHHIRKA